ncbi:KCNQ potassium channel [Aphelenchoides besseyi]|nr:KCNQ potassium channel [Aphelenchoides besseyi]KAI6211222.1 KCNQ potassium channel [Aphelenchoides besseyi]
MNSRSTTSATPSNRSLRHRSRTIPVEENLEEDVPLGMADSGDEEEEQTAMISTTITTVATSHHPPATTTSSTCATSIRTPAQNERRVFFSSEYQGLLSNANTRNSNNALDAFRITSLTPTPDDRQISNAETGEPKQRAFSIVGGAPLVYKNYRTDQRFRRMQTKLHSFLERPKGALPVMYHLLVLVMVLMCLCLSVFSTMPDFEEQATFILFYTEIIFVAWLAVEYACRIWSAGCRSRYRGIAGRLKFATSAYCIIDIIIISASILVLCMGATGQVFAASAIRGLRFFQILRMLRIDRRAGTWKLLGSVVWAHRQELLTTLYIGFLGLIFSSFLVYICEKNYNEKYETFADALYWGVITLTTVGYGDVSPLTWPGKVIGAFCALMGISFFALPAGILGSGFALKVQQHQRQKHLIRRRVPAARLIQCLWRHFCAAPESRSQATWKIYLAPPTPIYDEHQHPQQSLYQRIRNSTRRRQPHVHVNGTPRIFQRVLNLVSFATADSRTIPSGAQAASDVFQQGFDSVKSLLVPTTRQHDSMSIISASDVSEIESLGTLGFSLGSWRSKHKQNSSSHSTQRKSLSASAMTAALYEEQRRLISNNAGLLAPPSDRVSAPRPSTSPPATSCDRSRPTSPKQPTAEARNANRKSRRLLPPTTRSGRSLSLKDENIPAALLVGDYLIAPLYEWAERLRVDPLATRAAAGTSGQIAAGTANGTNGDAPEDGGSSETMPGTPCLNSTCGEEYEAGSFMQRLTSRRPTLRSLGNLLTGGSQRIKSRSSSRSTSSQHHELQHLDLSHSWNDSVPAHFLRFTPFFGCTTNRDRRRHLRRSLSNPSPDEDPPSIQPRTLEEYTPLLKNVIRAIRRMHVLVARRKFKEALRPYDVKDVIEQYSAGHVDLQARVKQVQLKLEQIIGGKQANKEDLKVSMVSRVVEVEKQVKKIDKKIDLLVEMFLEDRRHKLMGIRATATDGKLKTRRDPSPPHSATGRLMNSTPSQQLLIHKNSVPSQSPQSTARKRQALLLTSLPLTSSIDEPIQSSTETLEMLSVRSHFSTTATIEPSSSRLTTTSDEQSKLMREHEDEI